MTHCHSPTLQPHVVLYFRSDTHTKVQYVRDFAALLFSIRTIFRPSVFNTSHKSKQEYDDLEIHAGQVWHVAPKPFFSYSSLH